MVNQQLATKKNSWDFYRRRTLHTEEVVSAIGFRAVKHNKM